MKNYKLFFLFLLAVAFISCNDEAVVNTTSSGNQPDVKKTTSGELTSINTWTWDCSSKNALIYRVSWGTNGSLTIQRNNLKKIILTLNAWNQKDGWITLTNTITLPQPTSLPHTIQAAGLSRVFAKTKAHLYWGTSYIITGEITLIHSPNGGALIDETENTTVSGCFSAGDSHFIQRADCQPPYVNCITQ